MRVDFFGSDWSDYLTKQVSETVDKAGNLSSVAEGKVDIILSNVYGKFSSMFDGVKYVGETVTASDDFGTIYTGEMVSASASGGNFTIKLQSPLARYLRSVISIELLATNPATAIRTAIESFGLSSYIDSGSFFIAESRYNLGGMLINTFASAAQGMTLASYINTVGELGSLRVFWRRGKICCEYPEYATPERTLDSGDFWDVPKIGSNDAYFQRYSVDFVGSGTIPLPATGGVVNGILWQQSTGAGSPIQVATESAAHAFGLLRLSRDGALKKTVQARVDVGKVPIYVDDVYTITLPSLDATGNYRIQKYSRDANTALVTFEAVL